ncbi:GNAT family N-acetyltransferase [Bradyrhizobium sp. LMTR 3]|uniref:GNAT family N-acetyltransferase n=1 Tax=Bradyrhizobium sp. LMTR 3 TaxID=189873 RepID=UPI000810D915|nr:GNAT family N-acetyltransferase [Bradyrhizobium sp. LMTR 3]OCK55682.1 acetyltransferase [Bradyrhizobium sp. LMTR 3]
MTDTGGAQIRLLELADAALYRTIRLEALEKNPEAFGSTFERENAQPLSWFEAAIERADIFGAFLDGKLAGIAGFSAQEGLKQAHKGRLWAMYVRNTARGSGLRKLLVAAVLDHARGRVEMVQLTVVSENEAARRLYSAMGFVEYGYEKRALKQGGRYYDEILMVKFLDEGTAGSAQAMP